jgi:hypothetical protein
MPLAEYELAVLVTERLQTHTLDHKATGIGYYFGSID